MTQYAKGELRFECDWDDFCGQSFASRDDLDRHEREEHWNNLPDPDGSNDLPIEFPIRVETELERRQRFGDPMGLGIEK